MAEPAEALNPEPVEPQPEQSSSPVPQGQPEEPSVEVGTFLQFGPREYRNVTVAGTDPVTKRILAFRRNGNAIERVLIPINEYESALQRQKTFDKGRGIKQKKAMGRFVAGLLNRQIVHDGQRGQVVGYDAQRNEALLMVDGQPKWVSTPALLQSQKNIALVQTPPAAGGKVDDEYVKIAERYSKFLDQNDKGQLFEHAFTEAGKKEFKQAVDTYKKAVASGKPDEIASARAGLDKAANTSRQEIIGDFDSNKSIPLEGERKQVRDAFVNDLKKTNGLEAFEKRIGTYVSTKEKLLAQEEAVQIQTETASGKTVSIPNPPADFVESVSVPAAPGSISEQRQSLRIERQAAGIAEKASGRDWAALSNEQKLVYLKDSQRALLQERESLETYQIRIESKPQKTETDLRNLAEVRTQIADNRVQYSLQQKASDKIGRGLEVSVSELPLNLSSVFAGTVGVVVEATAAGGAVAGSQAQVIAQATAAIGLLNTQIGARQTQSDQLRTQIAQIGAQIADLNQQASLQPPQSEGRLVIEAQIDSANNQRRRMQDQMTTLAVQNADDRAAADSMQVVLSNVEQAPPEQASPDLVTDLQSRIPKNIVLPTAPLAAPVAAPARAVPQAPAAQIAPVRRASPLQARESQIARAPAPVPQRPRQGPVQQVKPPLPMIPRAETEQQRAVQLLGDQQAAIAARERLPGAEGVSDTYQQAFAEEGGVGGELSPLELGVQIPTTKTYAAGAPAEAEVEDTFMLREEEGRRRMAELNKPAQAPQVQAVPSAAPQTQTIPGAAAPAAPGAARPTGASAVQQLLSAQNQAFLQRDRLGQNQAALARAQAIEANVRAVQKLKRMYDVVKLGTALSFWGIVITILTMNIQTLNKYTVKIRVIPAPTLVEDLAVIVFDMLLGVFMLTSLAVMLIIPALIAAGIAGLYSLIGGSGGWYDWLRNAFTIVTGS